MRLCVFLYERGAIVSQGASVHVQKPSAPLVYDARSVSECVDVCALEQKNIVILTVSHKSDSQPTDMIFHFRMRQLLTL